MRDEIEAAFELEFPGLLFMDGLDDAIIGMSEREAVPVVVYSTMKILQNLVDRGMGMHEAREFMAFNIEGAFVGEHTPIIVDDLF
tara:strand:- start:1657 stop:1911 length:255 start_codon:yes stop_codon:yes gene_type:complete